jgi:transposase-like protein
MATLPADLTHLCYHDEDAARVMFESIRWPDGPFCPSCGTFDAVSPLGGKSMGPGWYWCARCRDKFTVRVGTVLERSHIPLYKRLVGFRLYASSKKGFSAHQLHRTVGVAYRSAWFMAHRIREAMRDEAPPPLGGENKVVEIDETYIGGKEANKHARKRTNKGRGPVGKAPVVSLVERDGSVRSFHVANVTATTLRPIIVEAIHKASYIMTDDSAIYPSIGRTFAGHGSVNHSAEEYVRAALWYTNTVENFFSIFKRGIYGCYFHVSAAHLHRYAAEFDFRYNNRIALGIRDLERVDRALVGAKGKRLTYSTPRSRGAGEPPF